MSDLPYLRSPGNAWISVQMERFWGQNMNVVENFNKEEEKEDNVVELKLVPKADITGPIDESPGWLLRMKKGTIFTICSKKQISNFMAMQLQMVNKSEKTALLYENLADRLFGRVVASRFEAEFRLVEILKEFTDEEITKFEREEEKQHEQHHRTQRDFSVPKEELVDPSSPA